MKTFVSDLEAMGTPAFSERQKNAALLRCIVNFWMLEDIVRVERVDNAGQHGWRVTSVENPPGLGDGQSSRM